MKRLLFLGFFLTAGLTAFAQDDDMPPGSGGPAPTTIPLDGGASILLASGVAYGLRQFRQRQKKNTAR